MGVGGTCRGAVGISRYVTSEVRAHYWTAEWLCTCLGPEALDTGALALASASDGADSGARLPRAATPGEGKGAVLASGRRQGMDSFSPAAFMLILNETFQYPGR